MKISARNQFKGIIKAIDSSSVSSKIDILIEDNILISSLITNDAVLDLDLQVGEKVIAFFKSTSIKLEPTLNNIKKEVKYFKGFIENIYLDKHSAKFHILVSENIKLICMKELDKSSELEIKIFTEVYVYIDSKDIMIAK
ncbi:MAG: TOBE domain-containing protein [Aliarcobacter sp.]|nr:TOBE domain-containing protein [Aliarcobacter sp.]